MDYTEALEYIHGTAKFGCKLGLNNITELMRRLGDPQKQLNIIHVAGTNGKGSVVSFLSSVLMAAGYRTGTYISPYVHRFNERIAVNGEAISDEDVARLATLVKKHAFDMAAEGKSHPTEFELVTAMAFVYYAHKQCDMVVLEVGLGGRLDATNVIQCPVLSIITSISLDHTHILGNTVEAIAYEKAGIIKTGGDVLVYEQSSDVMAVFEKVCEQRMARLWRVSIDNVTPVDFGAGGQRFNLEKWPGLEIRMLGVHQLKNAATVVKAVELLRKKNFIISDEAVRHGLSSARWPGRFEVASQNPVAVVDAAHNEQGAATLAENLRLYFPGERFVFVVGVLSDKDYESMISHVLPLALGFLAVAPDSPRALPASRLAEFLSKKNVPMVRVCKSVDEALRDALAFQTPVCVFGSIYILGQTRRFFNMPDA